MKKFLSLVLALVMAMSLVTISAGAKDFEDNSDINYADAVAVMSDLKVVDGYTDGTFRPEAQLNRGAAAKIICNMILGPTTAEALSASSAPFSDVAPDHVFAGYITYCSKEGIINGYADGTFRPTAPLTGYAFMKMLLGALGYDPDIEGYTGANWSVNVAKQAIGIGLDDGNAEFVGTKYVTREEACLYAFNTLQADMVRYSNKTTVTVNGAEVVVGGSEAYKTGNTFAEEYFTNLKFIPAADDFDRPAKTWKLKSKEIGTFAENYELSYTEEVKSGDMFEDLGKPELGTVEVYVDGEEFDGFTLEKKGEDKIGANGTLIEVYTEEVKNDDGEYVINVTIIVINTYVGEIDGIDENDDDERVVTVDTESVEYKTEEFEEEDIVLYTIAHTDDVDKIKSMELAEIVEDVKVSKINRTKNTFIADDETYESGFGFSAKDAVEPDTSYDLYLDSYGYVKMAKEVEAADPEYALVLDLGWGNWASGNDKVRLVLADGTKVEAEYENDDEIEFGIGDVVGYTYDDEDEIYTIKSVTDSAIGDITKGVSKLATGIYGNAKTVFFMVETDDDGEIDSWEIYTGIKSVPSTEMVEGATAYAYVEEGVAKAVVVTDAEGKGAEDMVYIIAEGAEEFEIKGVEYYEFNAIVDGEITTVVMESDVVTEEAIEDAVYSVFKSVTTNGKGYIVDVSDEATTEAEAVITSAYKNDVFGIEGAKLALSDECVIFSVDKDGEISTAKESALKKGETVVYVMDKDNEYVDFILIISDLVEE